MNGLKSKAVFFTGVDQVEVRTIDVPLPRAGEVLLETLYSCISPGTELRCLAGLQPNSLDWPFIPGYSSVGQVKVVGAGVALKEGTWVFCSRGTNQLDLPRQWGGHAGMKIKRENEVFPLAEGIDPYEASLATLAAISYHGLRLAIPQPHECVVVVGLGPIGMLSALLFKLAGCAVLGLDLSTERVQAARTQGLMAEVPSQGLGFSVAGYFPKGVDIVVDSTGVASLLTESANLLRDVPWDDELRTQNRLVVQGSFAGTFNLNYQEMFAKEILTIIPRDQQPRDIAAVLEFLRLKRLNLRTLLAEPWPVDRADEIYRTLRAGKGELRTAAFKWI